MSELAYVDVRIEQGADGRYVVRRLDQEGEPEMTVYTGEVDADGRKVRLLNHSSADAARAWVDGRNARYEEADKGVRLRVVR